MYQIKRFNRTQRSFSGSSLAMWGHGQKLVIVSNYNSFTVWEFSDVIPSIQQVISRKASQGYSECGAILSIIDTSQQEQQQGETIYQLERLSIR